MRAVPTPLQHFAESVRVNMAFGSSRGGEDKADLTRNAIEIRWTISNVATASGTDASGKKPVLRSTL
jgi:hypothetical protein